MNAQERNRQIAEAEKFVNERLKVDLAYVIERRDEIFKELSDYLELKNNILLLKENQLNKLDTLVNLGSQIYCKAKVPDTSLVYVKVGLGFHVQLSLDEALSFVDDIEVHLTRKANALTYDINDIRERIRAIYDTISQLLQLPKVEEMAEHKPSRNIL